MSKTIVFCADGTWNGPDVTDSDPNAACDPTTGCQLQHTNVCKLFAWLDGDFHPTGTGWGSAEMEKQLHDANGNLVQVAKYIHGVGNSQQLLDKVAGGAFGVGVTARIARGYTYISRNYLPGDQIVIVGFSRGAYTARALAGLIAGQGLLKPELASADDDTRYDTAAAAWYRWRHDRGTALQRIIDKATELMQMRTAFSKAKDLTDASFVPVTIAAVAVWDTVGSLGIPAYFNGNSIDLFQFVDTAISPNIKLGVHAVALDELRMPFEPTLWKQSPNVIQALFPGGHCDIGGGYPEHGLSDAPLLWVVDRLSMGDVGLKFADKPPVAISPDPLAPRHRAWAGKAIWLAAGLKPRKFADGFPVDDTVRQRMKGGNEMLFDSKEPPTAYNPTNLPH